MDNEERLKQHLEDVMNLRGKTGLSPFSEVVLKTIRRFAYEIDSYAGYVTDTEEDMNAFAEILESVRVNCTSDEVEVIEIALEALWWFTDKSNRAEDTDNHYLRGDEVNRAWWWLYMTDNQIEQEGDWDKLMEFRELGIEVLKHRERC